MSEIVASTPLINDGNLRRRTILRNALDIENCAPTEALSPLRRRSSVLGPVNTGLNQSVVLSDDNEERKQHRNVVEIQRRLSNVGKSPSGGVNDSVRFAGDTELKEHLQTCAKLFNENKINANNAWRLKIIDALKLLSRGDTTDSLQLASKSLDVSSRVYSLRVDDAHADGMKLASSIARMANKARPDDLDDETEAPPDDEQARAKKARAKKRKRFLIGGEKKTIARDASANLDELPMLESVLFSARAKPEASAVDNLFTNMLKTDNTGTTFELLGDKPYWCSNDTIDTTLKNVKNVPAFKLDLTTSKLCHNQLREFTLDEWDPEEELKNENSLFSQAPVDAVDKDLVFDDRGLPIPELDGSIHDAFMDNHNIELDDDNDNKTEEDVFVQPQLVNNMSHIHTFLTAASQQEYSFNPLIVTQSGKVMEQIWAGPSHWKLKAIKQAAQRRFTGQQQQVGGEGGVAGRRKVVRKRAAPALINLSEIGEEEGDDEEDKENNNSRRSFGQYKRMAMKKNAFTMKARNLIVPILDEELHHWETNLFKLQLNENVELLPKGKPQERKGEDDNDNYEVGDYNYDNCNDSMYCPETNDGEGLANGGEEDEEEAGTNKNAAMEFIGENLIDAPDLVAKTTIHFATHAKKMDMKKLKSAVWCVLTESKHLEDNSKTANDINPINFSAVYRTIPKLLTEKMRQGLSVHLALLAVLHLTNDNNLRLVQDKQQKHLKDFEIRRPDGTI